jgi:hypothetical protein
MSEDYRAILEALLVDMRSLAKEARPKSRAEKSGDIGSANYYRGVYDVAQQVADIIYEALTAIDDDQAETSESGDYLLLGADEVGDILERAGLYTRGFQAHDDGVFTAIFSRLQPTTLEQREAALLTADARIVILASGKLMDSGDPYIDFAFLAPHDE